MRHLVTGGAGLVGSHLCEALLAGGDEVTCVDNFFTSCRRNIEHLLEHRRFEFVRHDVCDPFHAEVDRIWALACPASPVHYQRNPTRTVMTSVLGTINALELARTVGARVLLTSTSEVYGDPYVHPQVEIYWGNVNPIGPRACYDEGKRCAETLVTSFAKQYGTSTRIARLFNTYGPRMARDDGRVVSNFVTQALAGQPLTIYGGGLQTRSFAYVDDIVRALILLMELGPEAEPVNVGNPDEFTIRTLAGLIREMIGDTGVDARSMPVDDPGRRRPDVTKLSALGWSPRVGIADGLERTIDYFRATPS